MNSIKNVAGFHECLENYNFKNVKMKHNEVKHDPHQNGESSSRAIMIITLKRIKTNKQTYECMLLFNSNFSNESSKPVSVCCDFRDPVNGFGNKLLLCNAK